MTYPRVSNDERNTRNTPPPSYDESTTIYPSNLLYANDYYNIQHRYTPTVFIIEQHPILGPTPVQLVCPMCQNRIVTKILKSPSNEAYLCFMLTFIFGCFICSCLPFCMDSFQKVDHSCPLCMSYIGTYEYNP